MSKPGLSFGLNLVKKPGASKPSAPPKRKPMFAQDDDGSDDDNAENGGKDRKGGKNGPQAISELDDFPTTTTTTKSSDPERNSNNKNSSSSRPSSKPTNRPPAQPPAKPKKVPPISVYGDLSSALESRRHQQAAEELDPSIYDYDGVYDSLKPQDKTLAAAASEDVDRRPKYMKSLMESAAVRRRDALIAEEKKIAREREAEGDAYADKERFVTEAYKRQQEENRRIEEEERRREEDEARKNAGGGMTAFYKDLLDRGDRRHAEIVQAAEERAKLDPRQRRLQDEEKEREKEGEKTRDAAAVAREINAHGGSVAINDDGEVVDKRELLKGGLNVSASAKRRQEEASRRRTDASSTSASSSASRTGFVGAGGGKAAMRERQSRMLEQQLEQTLKRSLDEEAEAQQSVERAVKSRKTDADISSARERYLARKRAAAAEEEKKKEG